jgi:hypothetical protein
MKLLLPISVIALGLMTHVPTASAVTCANGVYRAGCVGPNGAAAVHKEPVRRPATVTCAKGVYREGCAGPSGGAVVRRY